MESLVLCRSELEMAYRGYARPSYSMRRRLWIVIHGAIYTACVHLRWHARSRLRTEPATQTLACMQAVNAGTIQSDQ